MHPDVSYTPGSEEEHPGGNSNRGFGQRAKAYYQAFFRVLIDSIVELFGLIIKPFDNQTES